MAKEKDIIKLEKDIIAKLLAIKNKKVTPAESGIGKLINVMKECDEHLHGQLMNRYKTLLSELK